MQRIFTGIQQVPFNDDAWPKFLRNYHSPMDDDLHLSQLAEQLEATYMADVFDVVSPAVRDELGMSVHRIAGGVVTTMANDPTGGFWSRALGLGWSEPITDAVLDQVVATCDEHEAPAVCLQVSPLVAGDWRGVAARHGFTPGATWIKVVRDVAEPPRVDTDLVVRELGADDADEYARVYWEGFGFPHPPFMAWTREQTALPQWFCYAAFDGNMMVAVGALYIHDGVGALMGAATLPASRNRGGQGALMAARIRAAKELGCEVLFTETGAETPDDPNPSLHNMHRAGFRDLYGRQNLNLKLAH